MSLEDKVEAITGESDNPFRVSDLVLEYIVFVQGLIIAAYTLVQNAGMISVKQEDINLVFGMLIAVNLILMSGVMKRLRQE